MSSVPPTYRVSKLKAVEQLIPRLPGGTIGIQSGHLSRYAEFGQSLAQLARPAGSKLVWVKGVDIVGGQNKILSAVEGDWVWLMGDDHVFGPETLIFLLARMYSENLDVLVPFCLQRYPPFAPVVYKSQDPKSQSYYVYDDLPESGYVEVHAAGNAGMLIRKRVLDTMDPPWVGTDGKGLNEDLFFCRRIREAGFKIHCDVDVLLGHLNSFAIWPKQDEGWAIGIRFDEENEYTVRRGPTVNPPVAA